MTCVLQVGTREGEAISEGSRLQTPLRGASGRLGAKIVTTAMHSASAVQPLLCPFSSAPTPPPGCDAFPCSWSVWARHQAPGTAPFIVSRAVVSGERLASGGCVGAMGVCGVFAVCGPSRRAGPQRTACGAGGAGAALAPVHPLAWWQSYGATRTEDIERASECANGTKYQQKNHYQFYQYRSRQAAICGGKAEGEKRTGKGRGRWVIARSGRPGRGPWCRP